MDIRLEEHWSPTFSYPDESGRIVTETRPNTTISAYSVNERGQRIGASCVVFDDAIRDTGIDLKTHARAALQRSLTDSTSAPGEANHA